ncbi:hypothetical protein M885DRAFT_531320 [Pelagophyceae sp. CCMP2097]|nr:hypothetical protein M885DRAFT_531320 [Pelagophyceae sp. CCMP2097]
MRRCARLARPCARSCGLAVAAAPQRRPSRPRPLVIAARPSTTGGAARDESTRHVAAAAPREAPKSLFAVIAGLAVACSIAFNLYTGALLLRDRAVASAFDDDDAFVYAAYFAPAGVPPHVAAALLAGASTTRAAPGDVLVRQGDAVLELHLLCAGAARVVDFDGAVHARIAAGDAAAICGDFSFLRDRGSTAASVAAASVVAAENGCETRSLSFDALRAACGDPAARVALEAVLSASIVAKLLLHDDEAPPGAGDAAGGAAAGAPVFEDLSDDDLAALQVAAHAEARRRAALNAQLALIDEGLKPM